MHKIIKTLLFSNQKERKKKCILFSNQNTKNKQNKKQKSVLCRFFLNFVECINYFIFNIHEKIVNVKKKTDNS